MATGDLVVFDEAKAQMIEGNWASTDNFYCAILDNTTTPAAADTTPVLSDYTEVGSSGSYTSGGTDLGALSVLVSESGGTMTFDSGTNPTWAQNGSNDTDAWWALVYNYTDAGNDALCFIELGGPVDMSAGALTVTWNASGLFTIA